MKSFLTGLQQMGRALMLPIAVLPVAGLLLRLGQPDVLDLAPMAAAGDAIFSNLGLLFAIGVAVGLARENHGAAGLASVVGYLVTTKGDRGVDRRAAGRRQWPRRSGARPRCRGLQGEGAREAQRSRGNPLGPARRHALQPLQRYHACRAISHSSAAGASCRLRVA